MSHKILIAGADLSESFRKLVDECFIRVRGRLVERTPNGYIISGVECKTMEEVNKVIDESLTALAKSIK